MKYLLALFIFLGINLKCFSQTDSSQVAATISDSSTVLQDSIPEEKLPSPWTFGATIGLNVQYASNRLVADQPARSTFSNTNYLNLLLNYDGTYLQNYSQFYWTFTLQSTSIQNIKFVKYGETAYLQNQLLFRFNETSKWSLSLLSQLDTDILPTYSGGLLRDTTCSCLGATRQFMSPYTLSLSPGITFKVKQIMSISLSGYSLKLFGFSEQAMADKGYQLLELNPNLDLMTSDKRHFKTQLWQQTGALLYFKLMHKFWKDKKQIPRLTLNYQLYVNLNYIGTFTEKSTWRGTFVTSWQLLKNINLTHNFSIRPTPLTFPQQPLYAQTLLLSYTLNF